MAIYHFTGSLNICKGCTLVYLQVNYRNSKADNAKKIKELLTQMNSI